MADVPSTEAPPTNVEDNTVDIADDEESKEILLMKQRVEEMEREAKKLRELQAAAEAGSEADENGTQESEEDKAASDTRSVYVGNVDYAATPEEIQVHFQACGVINRVTIICDKFTGHPKGYAYVEFAEPEHVDAAVALDNSLFRGRLIKVTAKRTNIPGYNRGRAYCLLVATAQPAAYPFSKTALTPPLPKQPISPGLRQGKGLVEYLHKTLPTPEKKALLQKFFSRRSNKQLQPGSIVTVLQDQAPTQFTGVLIAMRRRGQATSFRLRNVLQRTGVEMQFFVNSPSLKEIKLVRPPPGGRMRRAKLFYLRDAPDKMSMLAGGKK
ncbi:hypothetical protein EST38_g674 [Candolleomyces aberdarensis]|uniref:RRM domain-containing protein n=1 Tax=Candolleomyces aberdarensis TaxID=2316362 RepID=A0A4V1Q5D5_9AGAR|nr:hypothetical protein EST38_g674 [Candolleomyces aberdarensis]